MKKIFFLITQSEMGGAQRFLLTLLSRLDRSRFTPVLAGGGLPGSAKHSGLDLFSSLEQFGFKTVRISSLVREIRPLKDLMALLEIRKLLKEEKPDILFLLSSKAGFLGSLAGRLALAGRPQGVPKIIYRIGGFAFHENISTLKQWLYWLAEWLSRRWKDLLIVNNRADEKAARRLGFSPEKIRYIPNGISVDMDFLSREKARQFFHLNSSDLVIGTIANFYANKGLTDFLDALALMPMIPNLPPIHVLIIGDGKERQALEKKRAQQKLSFVHLVGALPNASSYLKAFDLFVLPSRKEGMPWVILEAMLAGVPIVATQVGAVRELLEDQRDALLVPQMNPKALSEAIVKAISNAALRNVFSQHAKERLHRSFRVENMISACEACFDIPVSKSL